MKPLVLLALFASLAAPALLQDPEPEPPEPDPVEREVTEILPLLLQHDGTSVVRVHVPVERDGGPVAFLLDTGSALTYLHLGADQPDFVAEAGEVEFAGRTRMLPGRRVSAMPIVDGKSVIGTVGCDVLLERITELDLRRGRLVRRPLGTSLGAAIRWPRLAYEDVLGHMIVRVVVDGQPRRLILDTGSPHVLLLGEEGGPRDTRTTTTDAHGEEIVLFVGYGRIRMAGESTRRATILRAPRFPTFEETVEALGGDIDGLLGLSALGTRRIVIDPEAKTIRLEP